MLTPAAFALLGAVVVAAPPAPPAPAAVTRQLDAVLLDHWKAAGVTSAGPADDAAFLRRVYLDLTGAVPSAEQVQAFLADHSADKRAKLVDQLLAGDEFADYWGRVWAQQLTGGKRPVKQDKYDGRVLAEYLRDALKADTSYKTVVNDLITGEGVDDLSGPANFLLRYEAKPTDLAGATFKNFLGVSLQCAQCHNHPFTQWKQDDFWGVAAFYGRLRLVENGDGDDYVTAVIETRRGDLKIPDPTGKPDENGAMPMKVVKPRLPGTPADAPVPAKRRAALAAWVTAEQNPYFAPHAVNQTWTRLFGAGLMAPVDAIDKGGSSKLTEAMNLLAADFKANNYDLKRLVREIVLSRPYQLGSEANLADAKAAEAADLQARNFARFPVRPLTVDQLYQSAAKATGYKGDEGAEPPPAPPEGEEPTPYPGDRPVELLGERAQTVQRALVLLNGDYVHKAAQAGAQALLKGEDRKPTAVDVERVFLSTLSRKPTPQEGKAMLELVRAADGTTGLEDVIWAVINSAEFNSNH
jgi:hypothetical protein